MFLYKRKAYYHETDKMGVVHHSSYVKWMEETRAEFVDSVGLSSRKLDEEGLLCPVAGLTVDYKKPVEFMDEVEIRLYITEYDGTLLSLRYDFFNRGTLCTQATSKHFYIKNGWLASLKKEAPELDAILKRLAVEDRAIAQGPANQKTDREGDS